jgi:DNA-binding NarL/FixJ family response regulator
MRCVIVDDDDNFLRAARELLEGEGITVVGTESTGAQASRICRRLHPDVALVDINLGTETGLDVARLLAGHAETEAPKVILISGSAGDAFAEEIADSPAVAFLPKERLSGTAIRAILASAGSAAPPSQRDSR